MKEFLENRRYYNKYQSVEPDTQHEYGWIYTDICCGYKRISKGEAIRLINLLYLK